MDNYYDTMNNFYRLVSKEIKIAFKKEEKMTEAFIKREKTESTIFSTKKESKDYHITELEDLLDFYDNYLNAYKNVKTTMGLLDCVLDKDTDENSRYLSYINGCFDSLKQTNNKFKTLYLYHLKQYNKIVGTYFNKYLIDVSR